MGNCTSDEARRSRRNDTGNNNNNNNNNNVQRQWSDRGPAEQQPHKRGHVLQSMARVGSRVFRQSSMDLDIQAAGLQGQQQHNNGNGNAKPKHISKLKEHKASTYAHVHEIVEQGIDSCHETNHTNNGDARNNNLSAAGKVGLTNLGNTCFMNSSLQCLSNTIPLTDYFLGYDFRGEINYDNFLGTKGQLVSSYAELTKHLWLGSDTSYRPTGFKSNLSTFAPQFEGYEQHDAQELLALLLDGIHEDLNRVKTKPYIEDEDCDGTNDEGDAITAWSHYMQRNRSIIVDLFQGQLRNTMTCRKRQPDGRTGCGHVNVKFDPFMYLSLPISERCDSLDDCLDLFCEEECMEGDEQWYCPRCRSHVDATKKIDLFMLPPILIIHLKRFKFGSDGRKAKIDRSIRYPLSDWNLENAKKSAGGVYPLYDLYAVSHHRGDVGGGHYTARAKNRFDGEWYDFNDSQCRPVDVDAERRNSNDSSSAYCLFYNRVERVRDTYGNRVEKKTVIRRQSISRPELWPHLQRGKVTEWKSMRMVDGSGSAGVGFDDDDDNDLGLRRITE